MSSAIGIVKNYIDESIQATAAGVIKCKELRNDPDLFQRVGQTAVFALELIMTVFAEAAKLRPLTFAIATVGMFDFCRILKQPRQFFVPIDAETIDENATLESLTQAMYQQKKKIEAENKARLDFLTKPATSHPNQNVLDERAPVSKASVDENHFTVNDAADQKIFDKLKKTAKALLQVQLQEMRAKNDAYSNPQEFKTVLQNRVKEVLDDSELNSPTNVFNINWANVSIVLRHVPVIERITNLIWAVVDIGCIGLYLQTWKFVDTAQWAARIGQTPYFQWVRNQHLDRCVTGLVCTAFALKFIEACRKLSDDALTNEQRIQACWDRVTAATEFVLWGTVFLKLSGRINIDNTYIFCLGIIVKSIGVLSLAMRPKHVYFEQPKWASAASQ